MWWVIRNEIINISNTFGNFSFFFLARQTTENGFGIRCKRFDYRIDNMKFSGNVTMIRGLHVSDIPFSSLILILKWFSALKYWNVCDRYDFTT